MLSDYEVVIAGSGIAALSAALTSARVGRSTLMLCGGAPGGLLLSIGCIEGFPGYPNGIAGYELCPALEEQASTLGVAMRPHSMTGLARDGARWQVLTDGDAVTGSAVLIATGASMKFLGVPGEERLWGRGVSHCASCDAPLLRNRRVAVIGGGDSALQEALTLSEVAESVTILQQGPQLTAQSTFTKRVLATKNISVEYNVTVNEMVGDEVVRGVSATREGGELFELEVDGIFVYVGLQANSECVSGTVGLNEDGKIPTDMTLRTSQPGLFAAGFVRSNSVGRAIAAAGDGALAAVGADHYLNET